MKKTFYHFMGWVTFIVGWVMFIIPGLPGFPVLLLSGYFHFGIVVNGSRHMYSGDTQEFFRTNSVRGASYRAAYC